MLLNQETNLHRHVLVVPRTHSRPLPRRASLRLLCRACHAWRHASTHALAPTTNNQHQRLCRSGDLPTTARLQRGPRPPLRRAQPPPDGGGACRAQQQRWLPGGLRCGWRCVWRSRLPVCAADRPLRAGYVVVVLVCCLARLPVRLPLYLLLDAYVAKAPAVPLACTPHCKHRPTLPLPACLCKKWHSLLRVLAGHCPICSLAWRNGKQTRGCRTSLLAIVFHYRFMPKALPISSLEPFNCTRGRRPPLEAACLACHNASSLNVTT